MKISYENLTQEAIFAYSKLVRVGIFSLKIPPSSPSGAAASKIPKFFWVICDSANNPLATEFEGPFGSLQDASNDLDKTFDSSQKHRIV